MLVNSNSEGTGSPRNTETSYRDDTSETSACDGTDQHEKNKNLILAAFSGNVEWATLLLSEGASLQYRDKNGDSAAH